MKNSDEIMQKDLLENYLIDKLSKDSFQSPKSIEYAYSILKIDRFFALLLRYLYIKIELFIERILLLKSSFALLIC